MATTTPQQGLPVPELADDPNIVEDMTNLALAIEKKLVSVFESTADRDTRVPAPIEGQFAAIKDVNRLYCYFDGVWTQIYPVTGLPAFSSGSQVPNNANGANGDVYFQV